jgi:membrane-bound lytic murein transglycosylase D
MKYYIIVTAAFLSLAIFSSYRADESIDKLIKEIPQNVVAVQVPDYVEFASEAVPLDNFDAYERLDFQLQLNTFRPHFMIRNIKLSNRYFPTIEKILKEEGIPDDFKYLAVAESSLLNATSRSGAQGLWQFMPSTGKAFGLEINSDYKRFGSWTMAAAAYNTGAGRLRKKVTEQKTSNYYELELRDETSNYMFRIISIKEIMQRREQYGINVSQVYKELDNYKTLEISGSIPSLADFAVENGTTLRKLRLYNQWLISNKLTNKNRKTYQIKIPQE